MENALYFTEDYDEKDFVAVDRIRDKMRNNDSDYVETQIVKAVAEVKANHETLVPFVAHYKGCLYSNFCTTH